MSTTNADFEKYKTICNEIWGTQKQYLDSKYIIDGLLLNDIYTALINDNNNNKSNKEKLNEIISIINHNESETINQRWNVLLPEYYRFDERKLNEIPWNQLNDILETLKYRLNRDIINKETSRSTSTPSSPLSSPLSPAPSSPPQQKVLLSAKKAVSAMRDNNLKHALLASGRKYPKNRMPNTARNKTKRCTPNHDRKYSQTPCITHNILKKKLSLTFIAEQEHEQDEDEEDNEEEEEEEEEEEHDNDDIHFGWKSRESSNDGMNISKLSTLLTGLSDSSSNDIISSKDEEIERLKITINDKDTVIDEYETKLNTKSTELKQNEEEIKLLKNNLSNIEKNYESKAQCFAQELSKKTNEINQKETNLKEKESKIIKLENENKDLQSKLIYYKNRVSKMGKIEMHKSKFMLLNADYKKLKNDIKFQFNQTKQEFEMVAKTITHGLFIDPFLSSSSISSSSIKPNKISQMEAIKKERDILKSNLSELNKSYQKEKKIRKKLLEQVIDLKGNIRVFCRIRPKIKRNITQNNNNDNNNDNNPELMATTCLNDETIAINDENNNKKQFVFDQIYKTTTSQVTLFEDVIPLIESCLNGYNVCIFAYGQTGSGKTYTMEGSMDKPGIIYNTFDYLFNNMNKQEMKIYVSCLEIYNEKIKDLLVKNNNNNNTLKPKLSKCGKKVLVPGLTKHQVINTENVSNILRNIAYKNRSTGITNMNEHSSRSHALIFIDILRIETNEISRLVLIDLAGSERVKKSGVTGIAFDEARNINKSLSALGNVINSLQTKQKHIPFRDSQLTYLLYDCLGHKSSKALMFCNISCELNDIKESLNTLQFANRVRRVELGQASNNNNKYDVNKYDKYDVDTFNLKIKKLNKDLIDKNKEIDKLKIINNNISEKKDKMIKKLQNDINQYKRSQISNQYQSRNKIKNPRKRKLPIQNDKENDNMNNINGPLQKRRRLNTTSISNNNKIPSYLQPTRNSRDKKKKKKIKTQIIPQRKKRKKIVSSSSQPTTTKTRQRSTSFDRNNNRTKNNNKRKKRTSSLDSINALKNKNKKLENFIPSSIAPAPLTPTSAIASLQNMNINNNEIEIKTKIIQKDIKIKDKINDGKTNKIMPITLSSLQLKK